MKKSWKQIYFPYLKTAKLIPVTQTGHSLISSTSEFSLLNYQNFQTTEMLTGSEASHYK